jgi:hypothetical protein
LKRNTIAPAPTAAAPSTITANAVSEGGAEIFGGTDCDSAGMILFQNALPFT